MKMISPLKSKNQFATNWNIFALDSGSFQIIMFLDAVASPAPTSVTQEVGKWEGYTFRF